MPKQCEGQAFARELPVSGRVVLARSLGPDRKPVCAKAEGLGGPLRMSKQCALLFFGIDISVKASGMGDCQRDVCRNSDGFGRAAICARPTDHAIPVPSAVALAARIRYPEETRRYADGKSRSAAWRVAARRMFENKAAPWGRGRRPCQPHCGGVAHCARQQTGCSRKLEVDCAFRKGPRVVRSSVRCCGRRMLRARSRCSCCAFEA